jgi:hypothetical protein
VSGTALARWAVLARCVALARCAALARCVPLACCAVRRQCRATDPVVALECRRFTFQTLLRCLPPG